MKKIAGVFLIVAGIFILGFVFYRNSKYSQVNRTFAPYSILTSSWEKYKQEFINGDGRVLDHTQNDVTTSEGQSYALLRAVWVGDKAEFDKVWNWTKQNMKHKNDNLFGWRWGQLSNGSYGFEHQGGDNSASDADSDIALALIFASKRWNDQSYLASAQGILTDIWQKEVDRSKGQNYLVAGNWAKGASSLVINPSYFAPYAWRIFGEVDKKDNWNSLISPAYDLLNAAGQAKLDKNNGVGLPPDWVEIDRKSGKLMPTGIGSLKTNYSFDAMRVPFRIALDWLWFKDPQAKEYLQKNFNLLYSTYTSTQKLPSSISHDGSIAAGSESPAMYATSLGYFLTVHPNTANSIYQDKVIRLYTNAQDAFDPNLPYYDQNWLWFGTALYNNYLVNLAK